MDEKSNKKAFMITATVILGIIIAGIFIGLYNQPDDIPEIKKPEKVESGDNTPVEVKSDDKVSKTDNDNKEDEITKEEDVLKGVTVVNFMKDVLSKNTNELVEYINQLSTIISDSSFLKYFGVNKPVNPIKKEDIKEFIDEVKEKFNK